MRRTALLLAALTGLVCALLAAAPASAATTTARGLLTRLSVRAETYSGTYDRAAFRHWTDRGAGCAVLSGRWVSWYDGATWTNPSDVDIDHVVALKEAWESGARSWTATNRERLANDLRHVWSLDGITDNVNSSKGDRDPAGWLPPRTTTHCDYAIHWVAVKYRWRLSIDTTEKTKLSSLLLRRLRHPDRHRPRPRTLTERRTTRRPLLSRMWRWGGRCS